jgi:hypothetical protein
VPGVFRPYSLADVLGTLNEQSQGDTGGVDSVSGVGFFAETDENALVGDAMTTTVQVNPGWDQGVWGSMSWT